MSVIRLRSSDRRALSDCCAEVLAEWRVYTDESANIYAFTDGVPHNTITPIARMKDGLYECDLVLRNNITSDERPLGVYHPNPSLHHIKKENIGLIEVMGLAVLPARLATELEAVKDALLCGKDLTQDPQTASHAAWAAEFMQRHPEFNADNAMDIIRAEVGAVFEQVLLDAGVFKRDEQGQAAFMRFIDTIR
jgi:UDPglucose--hexose-1-phosphate uridylyltransferase